VYDGRRVNELLVLGYSEHLIYCAGNPPKPRQGFITFFDPGWSILQLRESGLGKCMFKPQQWYNGESFAERKEQSCYRQLHLEPVNDSFDKTFVEQQQLLSADEEVPSARVVVMGMAIHFLATGERLFFDYCVRCVDPTSDGYRVIVGNFNSGGISVGRYWDDYCDSGLGLASSRKF
jgi:hypothetical protein